MITSQYMIYPASFNKYVFQDELFFVKGFGFCKNVSS